MECTVDYTTYNDVIIIRDFKNTVTVDCILKTYDYIFKNKLITPETKGIISDYIHCKSGISIDDVEKLQQFHTNNPHIMNALKLAYVIDSPDIVYAMIFSTKYSANKSRPFSTIEAATQWVLGY